MTKKIRRPQVEIVPPSMPMIPEMLAAAMPPQLKPLEWNQGWVSRKLQIGKMMDFETATTIDANIAENRLRQGRANTEMINMFANFGLEMEKTRKETLHQIKMWELEQQKFAAEVSLIQIEANNAMSQFQREQREQTDDSED